MGFHSWFTWWLNHLPGKPIYFPEKDTIVSSMAEPPGAVIRSPPFQAVVVFVRGRSASQVKC